jgi:hypothetical protein
MNLTNDADYLKLLSLDQLFELLEELEAKGAHTSKERELVLKEIEGRK